MATVFCVIRHPGVDAPGTCPDTALAHHRDLGWRRVSDWSETPSGFRLNEFGPDLPDLDESDDELITNESTKESP